MAEIQLPVIMNPASRWYREHMKHRVMKHYSNRLAQVVHEAVNEASRLHCFEACVEHWRGRSRVARLEASLRGG